MGRHSDFIQLSLQLPANEYEVFVAAVRVLRRIMHEEAPNVLVLIQSKLTKHDATGLAEDYLERVGWPHLQRRLIMPKTASLSNRHAVRALSRKKATMPHLTFSSTRSRPPADLSRN